MWMLCQVFLRFSSCSHHIPKGICMNSMELGQSMLPFLYNLRFHMHAAHGTEVENQEKQLTDLAKIDYAEQAFRGDHERVVDKYIR